MLYGTTSQGGTYYEGSGGDGTVFRVSTTGNDERVLYTFRGGDGETPFAGVVAVKGKLYGTTGFGATKGMVYEMNLEGERARVLHPFTGAPDGSGPNGLTFLDGALYGTTTDGGTNGAGTVFRISP